MPDAADNDTRAQVRAIVAQHGRVAVDVASLQDDADLYDLGMTSRAGVGLLLALEEHFDVEFPDELLRRDVFQSVASIARAVDSLLGEG